LLGVWRVKMSEESAQEEKQCPYCGENIKAVAIKCKHCGEFLDRGKARAIQQESSPVSLYSYRWSLLAWYGIPALVLGYIVGQMVYGALFDKQVNAFFQGRESGEVSEGTVVFLSILCALSIAEAIAGTIIYRSRLPVSGGTSGALGPGDAESEHVPPKELKEGGTASQSKMPGAVKMSLLVVAPFLIINSYDFAVFLNAWAKGDIISIGMGNTVFWPAFILCWVGVFGTLAKRIWAWRLALLGMTILALFILVYAYPFWVIPNLGTTWENNSTRLIVDLVSTISLVASIVVFSKSEMRRYVGACCSTCDGNLPLRQCLTPHEFRCSNCKEN